MISWKSVEIIAGIDGSLNYPSGICDSKIDRQLYVTDMHNHRVCKIDLEDIIPLRYLIANFRFQIYFILFCNFHSAF